MRTLTVAEAEAFYDRFGRKQDSQSFYENAAVRVLIRNGEFASASHVVEFGCGTGRLARTLFRHCLPDSARYTGVDVSSTMVKLASERVLPWRERARVVKAGDSIGFPVRDGEADRVVSTYVLDLLSDSQIAAFLGEARRVLSPGGRLCIASLGPPNGLPARSVAAVWRFLFRLSPRIVGGCRPIDVMAHLGPGWQVLHRAIVVSFAITSEIVIAHPVAVA